MSGKGPLARLSDAALLATLDAARRWEVLAQERLDTCQRGHRSAWQRRLDNGQKAVAALEREAGRRGWL